MIIGVTWRLIFGYIITLIILILLAVGLSGCGTRKTAVDTFKVNAEIKEGSKSEGSVTKTSTNSETTESRNNISNLEQNQKQIITELFNENGGLKSRVTELESLRMENNSTNESKSLKTYINRIDSNFNNTLYKTVTITVQEKHKVVDADKSIVANMGGWKVIVILGALCICAVFFYFYLTKRR